MKNISLIILLISVSFCVYAQPPLGFNYQAVVRDSDGNLINNQEVSYEITILANSASGSIVYVETHLDTTNNYGLSNLIIGHGTATTGNFSSINWGLTEYFMRIAIDIEGGSSFLDMGTVQLLSVPYALHTHTSNYANVASQVDWDNVTDKPQTLSDFGIANPYKITVRPVGCYSLASVGSTYAKIGDIATFTKLNDESLVEIDYRGRLGVVAMTSLGTKFELRVDDESSTVGQARALVREEEVGLKGISTSISGYFEDLPAGTHTISIWARASGSGTATTLRINPNCFSDVDQVTIKEFK